jgi:hypothetical protein
VLHGHDEEPVLLLDVVVFDPPVERLEGLLRRLLLVLRDASEGRLGNQDVDDDHDAYLGQALRMLDTWTGLPSESV